MAENSKAREITVEAALFVVILGYICEGLRCSVRLVPLLLYFGAYDESWSEPQFRSSGSDHLQAYLVDGR